MPQAVLEIAEPSRQEIEQAQEAANALPEGNLEVSQLPDVARQLLSRILTELAGGDALSVMPIELLNLDS